MSELEFLAWAALTLVGCIAAYVTGRLDGHVAGMKEVLDALGAPDPFTPRKDL